MLVVTELAITFAGKRSPGTCRHCCWSVAEALAPVVAGLAIPFVGLQASANGAIALVLLVAAAVGASSDPARTGTS